MSKERVIIMIETVKRTLTKEDLIEHLWEQMHFLCQAAIRFDKGDDLEAKNLATTLRILLHDTSQSKSLLGQLELKNKLFLSTKSPGRGLASDHGLIGLKIPLNENEECKYIPAGLGCQYRNFKDWWNEKVVVVHGEDGFEFTRRNIILYMTNEDGGAHVDPKINEFYVRLSKENALGWTFHSGDKSYVVKNPERATVRQIAYELMRTMNPDFNEKSNDFCDIFFTKDILLTLLETGRNDLCPCGSGLKYKKCHGKCERADLYDLGLVFQRCLRQNE
jgi:hypothetical protein